MKIDGLSKSFGPKTVFKDFSIDIYEGQTLAVMGPSGCGKSTLLNIIAGLEKPDRGRLEGFEGKKIAYAFQEPRLIPWMTVRRNVDFVLPRTLGEDIRGGIADKWLKTMHLEDCGDLLPSRLSGGMAQRVSLARALAYGGDLLLLDEPFNGIDAGLRAQIIASLKEIWEKESTTVIMVTHDRSEAEALARRTIILNATLA